MPDNKPDYSWPAQEKRSLIGKRLSRVDGPLKVSGKAKYTYDTHRPGMLYAKAVRSPYAHAKVVSIDTSAAEKMPGVKAVHIIQGPDSEIKWAGDYVVGVAAVDENTARDAVRAIKVEYQPLPHLVDDFTEPKNIAEENGPLSGRDIFNMLDDDDPAAAQRVISLIQQRGIDFQVTPQMVERMRNNEVPDSVIKAVQAAPMKEPPNRKECTDVRSLTTAAWKAMAPSQSGLTTIICSLTSPRKIFLAARPSTPVHSIFPPATCISIRTT